MLFARTAANSGPDMHLQKCLSNYELSIVPTSLFAANDTMLHCSAKCKLKDILDKMSSAETTDVAPSYIPQPKNCVAIIDTMTDVQFIDKPSWIKTCKDLSAHFIALYKENMMNYLLCLTGLTFQNHLSQQQGICGLVILTLWHIKAQTLQLVQIFQ